MSVRHMIFDIGGVLVDWDPVAAFAGPLGGREAALAFIERVDFRARNVRADLGERFEDLAEEIDDPDDRALFATYVEAYPRTVQERIEGSWALLDRMKGAGVPVHAITNWSAETWPRGLIAQPRLGEVFETLVVSGEERLAKPDPAIFALFCARADVVPGECFFVDDAPHNVAAARAFGMQAEQFISPDALARDLAARGLL